MFSVGFSTLGCPDYGVDEVIALARRHGYAGVEIRFLSGTVDLAALDELSPAGIGETRRRFDDAGLEVAAIGTSITMSGLDPTERVRQMEAARRNLAIAEALGAPCLRVFGGPLPAGADRERTLDAIAEGLGTIAEMTAASGVATLIETHDDFCTSDRVLELFARGASPSLGVLWDTLHSHRHGEAAAATWAALGERIRLVHVKDAAVATPEAFDLALTGEGSVPVAGFLDLLREAGFEGYLDFEWEKGWHPEMPGPEVAIPHFAEFMSRYLRA